MNRTNQSTLQALFLLLTFTLLPCSKLTAKAAAESPRTDGEAVVIDGDLSSVDWRSLVGKDVTIKGNLMVVDNYDLARRGQVTVARERLYVPTSQIDPNDSDASDTSFEGGSNVGKVIKALKLNRKATIILDDGLSDQNIFPPTLFPKLGKAYPSVRAGSVVKGVSGTVSTERNNVVIVPKKELQWTPAKRPERPEVGEADVTVASFNLLNFFTTIDNRRNNARGADSKSELKRQEAKLVAAIIALNADVVGVMELENNLEAEQRLVDALNKEVGEEVFRGCSIPDGFREVPGGKNAIRVGVIYRSDRVAAVGEVSIIADDAFEWARTPIVQSFKSKTSAKPFTVIVNHFKSKGDSDRADEANKNKGDGQGAYNAARRSQSLAICKYIDELPSDAGKPRVLVIGDLNAYEQEDPIDALRAKGLVDLHGRFGAPPASDDEVQDYSYIYYGQSGSLDHAFATDSLANDVTGIGTWHINCDEPRFLDYNEEYNPKSLYKADPFRSSDHDPVLIGIGK